MFKVSKILVLSLLVVALCMPMAMATTTRVQSLAGTSNYINDDSDIFRWYGTLPSYANMGLVEVGQSSMDLVLDEGGDPNDPADYTDRGGVAAGDFALGFTYEFGEDHWLGTWAVFLLQNSIEDGSYYLFNPLGTPGAGPALGVGVPTTKFALAWGEQFEKWSIGVMFTRSDVMTQTLTGGKNDMSYLTIGAGVRWDLAEEMYGDASFTFGNAGGDTLGGWDKGTGWDLEARLFWEVKDDVTLVPYVHYSQSNYALKNEVAPSGDKWSDVTVGGSLNFDVNTNNMLIFAAEIDASKWEYSKADGNMSKIEALTLPKFYIALESDVTSWFTMRLGATKTMTELTTTDAVGEEEVTTDFGSAGDDFSWYLGGGFHVGEWDIDAMFAPDVPFRLGYWLTGYGTDDPDPPVMRASATYRF